jgi:hypothetical protein
MTYKEKVINAAIEGLMEGGISKDRADIYAGLLAKMYDAGYNEGMREQYVTQLGNQIWNK